jgi:hypothetical protein
MKLGVVEEGAWPGPQHAFLVILNNGNIQQNAVNGGRSANINRPP